MSKVSKFLFFIILPQILILSYSYLFWDFYYVNKLEKAYKDSYGEIEYEKLFCEGYFDEHFVPIISREEMKKKRLKKCKNE